MQAECVILTRTVCVFTHNSFCMGAAAEQCSLEVRRGSRTQDCLLDQGPDLPLIDVWPLCCSVLI